MAGCRFDGRREGIGQLIAECRHESTSRRARSTSITSPLSAMRQAHHGRSSDVL
jgi:hypothetical protein